LQPLALASRHTLVRKRKAGIATIAHVNGIAHGERMGVPALARKFRIEKRGLDDFENKLAVTDVTALDVSA
jgi:hypothetical protein